MENPNTEQSSEQTAINKRTQETKEQNTKELLSTKADVLAKLDYDRYCHSNI